MLDSISLDTLLAVELYAAEHDDFQTAQHFELAPDTISRYRRELKRRGHNFDKLSKAAQIAQTFDNETINTMLQSGRKPPVQDDRVALDFDGEVLRFIACGDTHWGSKYTPEEWWDAVILAALDTEAEFIIHVGDIVEGMSNRAGHVYELSHIGYDAQKEYAVDMLSRCTLPVYCIDGNHDRWFKKSNGALIVKDIARELEHVTFLGHDSAVLSVGGIDIMLWHGEDGASYAHSYRPQKVIEALPADDLPDVALMGHTHKRGQFEVSGVEVFQTGSIQKQSPWMRSTRKAAHTGFYAIELTIRDGHIIKTTSTWYGLGGNHGIH